MVDPEGKVDPWETVANTKEIGYKGVMEKPVGYARFLQLVEQPEPLTDHELHELRGMIKMVAYTQPHVQPMALMRANIETIDSIRRFDKASAALIETTNKLTRWVLTLTVLATLLGGGSLYLSYLALVKP